MKQLILALLSATAIYAQPSVGDLLQWNGTQWLNAPASGIAGLPLTGGTLTGGLTINGATTGNALVINAPVNTFDRGFYIDQTVSGTGALNANVIILTSDNAASPGFNQALQITDNFGGSVASGGRNVLEVNLYFNGGATSSSSANRNYVGIAGQCVADNGDGGTGTTLATAKGACFGGSDYAVLHNGSTNMLGVVGREIDFEADAGSSAALVAGLSITPHAGNAVHGSLVDANLEFGGGVGAANANFLIEIDDAHGGAPVSSYTTIFGTDGASHTLLNGIDFSSYTFTGNFLVSAGFSVSGTGYTSTTNLTDAGTAIIGGSNANLGPIGAGGLTYLENTGYVILGWNISGGGGETDLLANRGGGGSGGFAFFDYTNSGAANQLFSANSANGVVSYAGLLSQVTSSSLSLLGSYLGWNSFNGSTGETDIINNPSSHAGGFAFYLENAAGTSATIPMFINSSGLILGGIQTTDLSVSSGAFVTNQSLASVTATSNASVGSFAAIASNFIAFSSNKTGSGTVLPMTFFVGSTRAATFDTTGRFLINRTSDDGTGSLFQANSNISLTGEIFLSGSLGTSGQTLITQGSGSSATWSWPGSYATASASTQTAAISNTAIQHAGAILPQGVYIVTAYLLERVSGSGNVTLELKYQDAASAKLVTTGSMTLTGGNHASECVTIETDGLNNLTYDTLYTSTGTYDVQINVIRIG